MMDRIRLSGLGTYTEDASCDGCGAGIIVNGEAMMPIFYKAPDGTLCCPSCKGDYEDHFNETQSGGLGI
jgi:hypothetical protein